MKRLGLLILPLLLSFALKSTAAQALVDSEDSDADDVEITEGISFAQVDFTFDGAEDDNTTYGVAIVNYAEVVAQLPFSGSGEWYLNILIYDPPYATPRWAVQNLPIVNPTLMSGVSTFFSLLPEVAYGDGPLTGPIQNRRKVMEVKSKGIASRKPKSKTPKPPNRNKPRTNPTRRNNLKFNAQGVGVPVNFKMPDLPAKPMCPPQPEGETRDAAIVVHGDQESVQQDINQCATAAVSNSCQYLCDIDTCGDSNLGLTNDPGIYGMPKTSRVGRVDVRMGRKQGKATPNSKIILGKLAFLCQDWKMGDTDLVVKHQGDFCDDANAGGACKLHGNMDIKGDCNGNGMTLTSKGQGVPTTNFIANAITTDKADLEIGAVFRFGTSLAGHMVHVVGYAKTKGVDQIWYIHDFTQGDNNTGVDYTEGGRGFVCMIPFGVNPTRIALPNFPGGGFNAVLMNLIEEYPKPEHSQE